MEIDEKTLLVKILSFNCLGITSIFQQEIQKFNLENYYHIIFDIRDNPGGSVVEASNMIEFIAPETIEYPVNQQYSDRFMQKYREVCMC